MLEMLVQDKPLRARYLMISAEIPKDIKIDCVSVDQLPSDWRDRTAVERLRRIGTAWATQLSSAVLAVPSTIVPAETNYLLNTKHTRFEEISIGEAQELVTDLRLIKP